MNQSSVFKVLRTKYGPPEWVLFEEVGSGTGSNFRRQADALAMNLWPSRGLTLVGFEIKSHRGDWVRELKNPKKVEEGVFRYCDHWYVVEGEPGLVREGELPPTWGLMTLDEKGQLKVTTQAPQLVDPKPISRTFMAAVLRCAARAMEGAEKNAVLYQQGYEAGENAAIKLQPVEMNRMKQELQAAVQFRESVEKARGEKVLPWEQSNFCRAVKVAMQWYYTPDIHTRLDGAMKLIEQDLKQLRDMKKALRDDLDLPARGENT